MAYTYPVYAPQVCNITSVSNANPAVVTTGDVTYPGGIATITPFVNEYLSGTIIRLVIPPGFGMSLPSQAQVNVLTGEITVIDDHTFSINIDTPLFQPFILPAPITLFDGSMLLAQNAQAVPFSEDPGMLTAAVQNVL